MNAVEAALRRITADLNNRGQHWALVGGFAVSARAEPRFTRDVDVAVAVPDDTAAESLVRSLLGSGYRLVASVEQEATGRLATIRLTTPIAPGNQDAIVDVLFASSGIEPEIAAAAEPVEILPGVTVPVAGVAHLIAVKLLARDDRTRPQDLADLNALLGVATPAELEMAREAAKLISKRGFDRGRDLIAALDDLLMR
ncbi:MAG TPA: nucleotidyl transferase AbiEii/AbiGii toxin family protein [Actinoplanes sp.]|nr:nucleotidyl transferase AbiEii/AbiGii toxin family protein [Actinoplanes sp.]